jgi:hypothetical protein
LNLTIKRVVKLAETLLIIISSTLFNVYSQSKNKFNDSVMLKKEIDSVLAKHGLKSKGFAINVISINQKAGQTAYSITNNYYGNVNINTEKELTEDEKLDILKQIDSVKSATKITNNDIMLFKSQNSNAGKYVSDLRDFLTSKGYDLNKYITISYPHDAYNYSVGAIDAPSNRGYCILIVIGRFN